MYVVNFVHICFNGHFQNVNAALNIPPIVDQKVYVTPVACMYVFILPCYTMSYQYEITTHLEMEIWSLGSGKSSRLIEWGWWLCSDGQNQKDTHKML